MKLAEGLLLRADLQKKIVQMVNRITPVIKITQGKSPQEDSIKLMAQMRKAIQVFEAIVVRINKTNIGTSLPDGRNLMGALAHRDALKTMVTHLRTIRQTAQISNHDYNNTRTTIKIKQLQSEIDQVGRAFRELDSQIQELNWLTELKE